MLGVAPSARLGAAVAALLSAVICLRVGHRWLGAPPQTAGSGRSAAALLLVVTALCLAASGMQGLLRDSGRLPALARDGATVRLVAGVVSDPRLVVRSARADNLVLVRVKVLAVEGRGLRSGARGRVLVFADRSWLTSRWGQRVEVRGRLAPARPADDVVATLDARGPPRLVRDAEPVARATERLRAGLRRACAGLPPDARGLLPGLVVGDTSAQPADLTEDMRTTGLTHLAAVSGTNITIVCAMALGLFRGVGLGRRARLVLCGAVLTGFVVMARPEPSVLRAAVMGGLGLVAVAGSRRRVALPALSAAMVALLVADPWLARSYGFALSVLATTGLLLLAEPWSEALSRRMPRPLAVAVAVPVAAHVACAPVVVLLSAQISLVAIAANLVCEPLVAPATVLGVAAAVVSPVAPALATIFAQVGGWACALIAEAAHRLADVPGAQVPWPGGPAGAAALAAVTLSLLVGVSWLSRHSLGRPALAAATCGVLALALAAKAPIPGGRSWPPPGWVLVACDVGQGDALALSTAPGRAVLIDAGPDPEDVDRCLRRLSVRALDAVVLTHFHADHVDGLPGVLRKRTVGEIVVTLVDDPPAQARHVRRLAAAEGVPVRRVVAGEHRAVGSVDWVALGPERVIRDGSVPNNASIVLLVRARGVRLLLLGDVEPAAARHIARRLAAVPDGRHVDVMKVAHHGSPLQDPGLLATAHPDVALVSVGAGNDYGHPSPKTLRLLSSLGSIVGRTDLHGDLAVVRAGGGLRLVVSGPRQHREAPGRS